ncbi:HAD family hydrolase [Aestuariimicrobium kwangyangense]|uniref:HAD family hydrolase n=1 Tax=Aestuariimicrobium kwangyangense TaxID=396389 RepID=UPI0003B36363|nr:HAD hydrolase-like protein [Aestuariimicrobium kwangyangense]
MLGFDEHLHVSVGLEDSTRHKPHPEPLLTACKTLAFDPAAAVYVGDAAVDLLAAVDAGMDGLAVTWGAGLADDLRALPNAAVVDTAEQLSAVLLG